MQGGTWIYAAQRTTNVGRGHAYVVCHLEFFNRLWMDYCHGYLALGYIARVSLSQRDRQLVSFKNIHFH